MGSKTLGLNVLELQFLMLANHDQNVYSCFRLAQSMCLLYSWNQVYCKIYCVNLPSSINRELDSIDRSKLVQIVFSVEFSNSAQARLMCRVLCFVLSIKGKTLATF